jgi:CP family cyanate transporter-like MFS transporter
VFGFLSRDEDRRLPLVLGAATALAGMLAIALDWLAMPVFILCPQLAVLKWYQ